VTTLFSCTHRTEDNTRNFVIQNLGEIVLRYIQPVAITSTKIISTVGIAASQQDLPYIKTRKYYIYMNIMLHGDPPVTEERCGYILVYKIRSTAGKESNPPAGHILKGVYRKSR
jgi:hypothetical protein